MKSLIIRAISGLFIVLLTIFMISKGGILAALFIFLLSIIGIREFFDAIENKGVKPIKGIGYISCIGFLFYSLDFKWVSLIYIFIFVIIALIFNFIYKKDINFIDSISTIFGILYIPFLMEHIIYLDGTIYIWLIFIIAWGTDTFAYLSGSLFGKTKLCPKLSPKKTVEGSLGGILGAIILTLIYAKYFGVFPVWKFVLLSLIGSIIAQIGDLTASKIKRLTGIKDFGFIMPGHGGVLDRFDSILFTAPFIYYFVNFFL
ncbi:phosphatidate cytidylyltransferase [Clostridium sp. Cult1]|uniref:phosphatidate cytidylyltransferase n=1 Tax=Clostridium sp. Cult1 TaxID=2079002 RepID=UPI001F340945|nr:phosphatidate cytidylyltransferase [Clostridium sp. Cult1]